jgi:arylsulfatase A-like enzyme
VRVRDLKTRRAHRLLVALALALLSCAGESTSRPSILLFVLDTTRADAVSAYGAVADTTPTMDSLARAGLLYRNAYAQAPWTLPSHATLFTGLLPSQHRIGWNRTRASDALMTLAEVLRDEGYETFGISENPWVTALSNLDQGFDNFIEKLDTRYDLEPLLERWLGNRTPKRPFFLFINLIDPHAPYRVRERNAFLPEGVSPQAARKIPQNPDRYFCSASDHSGALEVLHGAYLDEVLEGDAKLGRVLEQLENAGMSESLVTIVTSDHGEHFGEHERVSHQFSVRDELLRVPLIVHGLEGVTPAAIDAPVQLADVFPTVLGWLDRDAPEGLISRPLPVSDEVGADAARAIIAEYDAPEPNPPPEEPRVFGTWRSAARRWANQCDTGHRARGDMRALVRNGFKLIWYEEYPAELYAIDVDPREQQDLATLRAPLVADLSRELDRLVGRPSQGAESGPTHNPVPPDVRKRLEELGYLEGAR